MTLREELEARFEDMEAQKQARADRREAQIASAERRRCEDWLHYGEYAATAAEQGLTGTMEYMGATLSPVELVKVPRLASVHVKTAKRAANSKINGLIYGWGVSEDLNEYPLNIFTGIVGNWFGHKAVNNIFGRGINGLLRQLPEEAVSTGVNWVKEKAMDMYNQWK